MKSKEHTHWFSARHAAAAVVIAACAVSTSVKATDTPDYKPAHLISGYCGDGSLEIEVHGKRETVHCANLDTHTGQGFYEREHCYQVEHYYDKGKGYGNYHGYGYDKHWGHKKGYYKHCEKKKFYYQLPVIEIEKRAYDHYHKLISTSHSDSFDFHVYTNGGYGKKFQLKSKQKKYLIVAKDHYTISEYAPYYKTRIECGGDPVHGQTVTIGISEAGQKKKCVFHNYKPYYKPAKPVYKPAKPVYKPAKPVYKPAKPVYKPAKPVYKPVKKHYGSCSAYGRNLDVAKYEYARKCHAPLLDCDPMNGGVMCSSHQIGRYAPEWRR